MNLPRERSSKADVSSFSPSPEQISITGCSGKGCGSHGT